MNPQDPSGSRADSGLAPEGVGVSVGAVETWVGVSVGVAVIVSVGVIFVVPVICAVAITVNVDIMVDCCMGARCTSKGIEGVGTANAINASAANIIAVPNTNETIRGSYR